MIQTKDNGKKPHFVPDLNLVLSVTMFYGQLLSCTISEKTNDPILRELSDGWMDGQMNQSDFMRCCPTRVKHPVVLKVYT